MTAAGRWLIVRLGDLRHTQAFAVREHMLERTENLERVRNSVVLVRCERTAALRFVPTRINVQPSLDERLADRAPLLSKAIRAMYAAPLGGTATFPSSTLAVEGY